MKHWIECTATVPISPPTRDLQGGMSWSSSYRMDERTERIECIEENMACPEHGLKLSTTTSRWQVSLHETAGDRGQ